MKQKLQLILSAIALFFLQIATTYAQTQTFQWAKGWGGGTNASINGKNIATDVAGNVYTTGSFTDTVDFDPGSDTFNLISIGGDDFFISKLDVDGNLGWVKQFENNVGAIDAGKAITTDASGNIYTVGLFSGTIDFDPGPNTFNLTTAMYYEDIFILKLDASGNFVWAKKIAGSGNGVPQDIKVDGSGFVYITGELSGTMDFDPGTNTSNLVSAGQFDVFVLKLNNQGDFIWAKQVGGQSYEYSYTLTLDASGNIYTAGWFVDSVDFDPGSGTHNLITSNNNNSDIFILKLNPSGDFVWVKHIGGSWTDVVYSLTTDASGSLYATGYFSDTADFDPGVGTFNLMAYSSASEDAFVLKLDATGNFVWVKQMGGIAGEQGHSVFLDASGNIYTTGHFHSMGDYDPGAGTFNLIPGPGYSTSVFISKLNASGNFVWAKQVGRTGGSFGMLGTVIDPSDNIYVYDYFGDTLDCDPDSAVFNLIPHRQNTDRDVFVLKLGQPSTTAINEQIADLSSVILYPNPNAGSFTIRAIEEGEYTVVNELGQAVRHFKLNNSNNYTTTVENLSNGIYFVTGNSNNNVVRQKIVVTK